MNFLVGKGITISQSNTQQTQEEASSPQVPLSPEVKTMIRRKISSYLNYHLQISPQHSKQIVVAKKAKPPLPKEYPQFTSLLEYFQEEKLVYHLFKEKIDRNLDQCQYFFFKTVSLVMDYECRVSGKELDMQSSIMIDAFLFLASSLLEVGADKAAFYFASLGLQFCEYCKILHPIGQFLLIAAKISRKQFRYRESILMLKKALEYNWWKDKSRSDELNQQFIEWMNLNCPEEVEIYQQKYELGRVFYPQEQQNSVRMYRSVSVGKDLDCGVFRDFFQQFLEGSKIRLQNLKYDVHLKKARDQGNQQSNDLQIAIYNQLSFNFLQLNMKEESKIFAQKYESGYLEPEDSKIKALSSELIHSIQKRISGWHRINRKSFELLLYVDLFQILQQHRTEMRSLDQENIIELFKISYESSFEALMRKDIFSYQIPLPLEIRRDIPKMKRKSDGRKFIVKQRSISHMGKGPVQIIKDKFSSDKVEENLLLNFRGAGVSRLKLLGIYSRLMDAIRSKEKQGSFKMVNWTEKC